jgi:hypothetical protein
LEKPTIERNFASKTEKSIYFFLGRLKERQAPRETSSSSKGSSNMKFNHFFFFYHLDSLDPDSQFGYTN